MIALSVRYLALYCGLRFTPDDLIQADVVPLTVNFLWPHSRVSGCKKSDLEITESNAVSYHYVRYFKSRFCRICSFYQWV